LNRNPARGRLFSSIFCWLVNSLVEIAFLHGQKVQLNCINIFPEQIQGIISKITLAQNFSIYGFDVTATFVTEVNPVLFQPFNCKKLGFIVPAIGATQAPVAPLYFT
jgi:hypothetical protein